MADIFISYKREDRDRIAPIVEALGHEGFSVWWDQSLAAGEVWDREIERQIALAACVLVAWTRRSVVSRNVCCEADFAVEAGTLIPIRLEECSLPLFQRTTQQHDLRTWRGDRQDESWRALVNRVSACIKARARRTHGLEDSRAQLPMWGFGIAPPKPHIWSRYNGAVEKVRTLAQTRTIDDLPETLAALSEVKGLFNRIRLKDQWDWFIVWQRLGFPSIAQVRKLADAMQHIRAAAKAGEDIQPSLSVAKGENLVGVLNLFLGDSDLIQSPESGIAYILAAKNSPGGAFVGVSKSGVVEVADNLNSALGLKSPLGVFHAWRVTAVSKAFEVIVASLREQNWVSPLDLFRSEVRFVNQAHGPVRDAVEQWLTSADLIEQYVTKSID